MKEIIYQALDAGWEFNAKGKKWLRANVPGSIHLDLLKHNIISDPFFGKNEFELQWISNKDWIYRVYFIPEKNLFLKNNIQLCFYGLDTYADIYLNEKIIISSDNMFHSFETKVKDILLPGKNELIVHFRSPLNEVKDKMDSLSHILPADNDRAGGTSPFTRKAAYQYGWDWGPCMVTSGIWKRVEIVGWDNWLIDDVIIKSNNVNDERAELIVEIKFIVDIVEHVEIVITESRTGQSVNTSLTLEDGLNSIKLPFNIDFPDLWWPHGHGDQTLHRFDISISSESCKYHSQKQYGIRDVTIIRTPDENGESFSISVNGKHIYAKGANWIPADFFTTRVNRKKYKILLQNAIDANMNTLRVWGGGIYESKYFYELCDEMGIMVWQDFMFACSMYPADNEILTSIEKEVRYQLQRLKGYACIILWCGNNEIASGWLSWGWKETLPKSVWEDYNKLYHNLLPHLCKEVDPERLYWPTSPGHSTKSPNEDQIYGSGDNHYWGVWHGGDGFGEFENNVGRFMSEYGMQSFPDLATIESFTNEKDRRLDSDVMNAHQKASLGTKNLMKYIEEYYNTNDNFESLILLSQVMQAQAIKSAVESHRRNMPYCMGTLYWQFNDCWPVISWSSIDYLGKWKALHYQAKKFFNPVLVSIIEYKEFIEFHIVNDQHKDFHSVLYIELYRLDGSVIFDKSIEIKVKTFSSNIFYKIERDKLINGNNPSQLYLQAKLTIDGNVVSKNNLIFVPPKELGLQLPRFHHTINKDGRKYNITIVADSFLCQLHLQSRNVFGLFSDNYFDVIPNEEVVVEFIPSDKGIDGQPDFEIGTLYELMN